MWRFLVLRRSPQRVALVSLMLAVVLAGAVMLALTIPSARPALAARSGPAAAAPPELAVPGVNEAQLSLTKSVSDEPLLGGGIGFNLTVKNTASTGDPLEDDKAYNVSITDTLPAGVTFSSATPPPSLVIVNPDGTTTLVWNNLTDLEQQESTSVSIQATIKPTVTTATALVNSGTTSANQAPDNSQAYITATNTITAYPQAIDIEKRINQSTGVGQATGASG